jgi:hypothetical protein
LLEWHASLLEWHDLKRMGLNRLSWQVMGHARVWHISAEWFERVQAPPATVAEEDLEFTEMACGLFSDDEDSIGEPQNDAGDASAPPMVARKQQKRRAKCDSTREQHKKRQEQALQAKRELKAQRRDADNAKMLVEEIEVEEEGRLRHIRRRQVAHTSWHDRIPLFQ